MSEGRRIAVIGLGYVGLPVAVAFAAAGFQTTGFDVSPERIAELKRGEDRTREVDAATLENSGLHLSHAVETLQSANFYIITVPTPIDDALTPDLSFLLSASRTVGSVLGVGDIVVFESTVYPGATEERCVPVLETASGLRSGVDFSVGYSPERINPGDDAHRLESIVKVVSGQDARTLDIVAEVYGSIVPAGVHRAPSIKTAEAAKVIENIQRDLNIALMNELAILFGRLGLDTCDVLEAAGTKWNFLPFRPGLVGGHCIGVDPYYLTHKAQVVGFHPQVILAGRRANDGVASYVVGQCILRLVRRGAADPRVTVLGITFKENVPDIRNSGAADMVRELLNHGLSVQVADPEAHCNEVEKEYGLQLTPLDRLVPADAIILAVPHRRILDLGWRGMTRLLKEEGGLVFDVKAALDRAARPENVELWRL